ncbi:hypothetical protein [Listonella phage phiHSIC]|uniref:hypothetical protein n=1 Tax=Listonella phage phiHSIC TaxID=310539 RepID=UPI00004C7414|nr:hypothetical protein LPPPVgp46 [Listonella phage phiHSIC]AAW67524.1 hypothetical protein [Listonella phage phiHSIC]
MAIATEVDVVSPVGTIAEVKAGFPATFDAAGFSAHFDGLSETELGLMEDFTIPTSSTTVETFNDMKSGQVIKVLTFTDAGDATLVTAHVIDDDGQAILIDHHNGANKTTPVSIKLSHSDGSVTYYAGKVSGYEPVKVPLNRCTYTIAVDKKMVEVAAP